MSIKGYFGPKRRPVAPAAPAPEPTHSQDELRDLRRRGVLHVYRPPWSLAAEIDAIATPLARRLAAEPGGPFRYRVLVAELADKTHALVAAVVGMVAQGDAEARTRDMAETSPSQRGRSIRLLVDLAERPPLPDIDTDMLRDGSWAALLTALAQPYSDRLADLLARAHPPGSPALRGRLSISDRLERELREVDLAALGLSRKIDAVTEHRRKYPDGPPVAAWAAERAEQARAVSDAAARAELARLGIEVEV